MTPKAKLGVRKLDDVFFVSAQIAPRNIPDLKTLGFNTIMNNRPDYEMPGQPTSKRIEQSADRSGLTYHWIPISGEISEDEIDSFSAALNNGPKPILAFCRSGARCAKLWALSQAGRRPTSEITRIAKKAGYDISAILPQIYKREKNVIDPYSDLL